MTLVVDKFAQLLPPKSKNSPSGWTSFNAPCCHHRGHKPDTRKRAGIRFDSGIVYNCFNCKFTTGWQPGSPFGEKIKTLCRWLGASEDLIKELVFESLKTKPEDLNQEYHQSKIKFTEKTLPENSHPLGVWAEMMTGDIEEKLGADFVKICNYLINRGFEDPFVYDFYWSPEIGYSDRVIIPFRWEGRIVGSTARKIKDGKPKYLSDQHPHFVFNFDVQTEGQKYTLVTEGPFDALAVNGVALLTNEIADNQSRIIDSLRSEVVVIPDQDRAGLILFDRAIELGWSVASPTWEESIKDPSEAAAKYGRLFVVVDAIATACKGPIKITMAKKRLEQKLERLEHGKID